MKMADSDRNIIIFNIFTIILMLLTVFPVYGKGSKEGDLSRADALIESRDFDEAVFVLTDFARRNPNEFDQVQRRLRGIYRIRDEFNRTADELIDTLINDPENNEKILNLSRHLYTLEKEDSPLLVNFVARNRELAAFNVYRNRLRSIMERGRAMLDAGDCPGAISVYTEGMNFMHDEFYTAAYGEDIETRARRETERLHTLAASFTQVSSQMGLIAAEYTRAANAGDLSRMNEIIVRLTPAMDVFIALKNNFYNSSETFSRILESVRAVNPNIGDRSHVAFIIMSINGRSDESIQEGMLGAFDTYWENSIGSCIRAVASYAENAKSASISAINAKNYPAAVSSSERIPVFIIQTNVFFNRHRLLLAGGNPQTISLYANTIAHADIPSFINLRSLNESNTYLQQAANVGIRLNAEAPARENNIAVSEDITAVQQARNNINSLLRSIQTIKTNALGTNTEITRHFENARLTAQFPTHIPDAVRAIDTINKIITEEDVKSANRYYALANQRIQDNLIERKIELERSKDYINGESRANESGEIIVYRYPAEALQTLTAMMASITTDLRSADAVIALYRNEPREVSQFEEIVNSNIKHQTAYTNLEEIRAEGLALVEISRRQSTQAIAYRQEGERHFREAQAAFQRRDYDTARDRLQSADSRFNSSLEIQESASLRQMRDTLLISLGQSVSAAQSEAIINEVRGLINGARNSYFNGSFQQAEENLVRARSRWSITSPDENEEIVYWLGIVRNALSMSSERVISPTAPLYPEMSQLLSQAQRNYEEGVRLVNSGQRASGIIKFDEARQLTREVRLMFPLNQEAGILDLRIEQFLDPAAFNALFEQRLRTAQARTRQRSMEAFADLQNLAEINPRYQNMRAILTQAEIDIGIRPPPPNPADVARSRELTASANRIYETSQAAQYEVALRQLNEAIIVNPENTEASRIRDRLLSRMNVPGAIILTNEDEADYQRALREHNAGNNLVAWALIERLMQNPRNRNITKVVELQQRIRSVL